MNIELVMQSAAVRALGLAIFHSLWQAVIVFCLLQTLLFWLRPSASRYRALFIGLCTIFAAFIYTFFEQLSIASATSIAVVSPSTAPLIYQEGLSQNKLWWQSLINLQHSPLLLRSLPLLTMGYALGIIFMGLRTVMAFRNVFQLRKQVIAPPSHLEEQVQSLKTQMQLRKKIEVYVATKVKVPAMLGLLKPIIVLPLAMANQLDKQQVEAILLHELAHIRRNDYLFNILQMVMETILFFNPMVWWLSATIRKERELACDDMALKHLSNPVPYAQALLLLEEARLPQLNPALALTGTTKKHFLLHRIKRITNMDNNKTKQPQGTMVAVAALMVAVIMAGFFVAGAQDNTKENKTRKVTQKTTTTHSTSKITVKDEDGQLHTYESENSDENATAEVTKALQEAKAELEQLDTKSIKASLETARAALNSDAVRQAMKEAASELEKVDWRELEKTVQHSLKEVQQVDWEALGKRLDESLQSLDEVPVDRVEQAVEELKKAIDEMGNPDGKTGLNREAIKKLKVATHTIAQASRAQEIQVKQNAINENNAQRSARLAHEKAKQQHAQVLKEHKLAMKQQDKARIAADKDRVNVDKLLAELNNRNLVTDMDNVHVEMKNDGLYINGQKQASGVYESIKQYAPPNAQSTLSIHKSTFSNKQQ